MNSMFVRNSVLAAGAVTLSAGLSVQAAESKTERKPNIVFILADDLGYGDISVNGQKHYKTPNIDRIAKEGINFTQFYSPFPVCAPARCAILTGKHAGHCAIRNNGEMKTEGQMPLPAGEFTIAEMLKKEGYATACIGKWGLGFVGTEGDPNNQGFDLFFGYNCQRLAHHYYPKYLWRNSEKIELPGNLPMKGGPHYAPYLMEAEALKFIEQNKDTPFFLWYTTPIPHASLQVPDTELNKFKGKFKEPKPFPGGGYAAQSHPRAAAAAMVSRLDDEVGNMMAKIKALGLDDNTIFIFSSDNGPSSEGGKDLAFFNSTGGDRGNKGLLTEGGVHVPFMIRWAKHVKPSTCKTPFAFYDLMSTIADISGVKDVPANDGISFLSTLEGNTAAQSKHDRMYWEFSSYTGQTAVRIGNWKGYANGLMKPDAEISLKLFDLSKDPQEKNDVAAQHPEIIGNMMKAIKEMHTAPIPQFRIPAIEKLSNPEIQK